MGGITTASGFSETSISVSMMWNTRSAAAKADWTSFQNPLSDWMGQKNLFM
ncbi:hypothetical protein ES703_53430 [subsurface metagenome]